MLLLAIYGYSLANLLPAQKIYKPYNSENLKRGDIIFRKGIGAASDFIVSADEDSPYSHVGLLEFSEQGILVIHITPPEVLEGKNDIRVETLEQFLKESSAAAVYRFNLSDAIAHKAVDIGRSYLDQDIKFDAQFNLESKNQLYCTEFVWLAYLEAGVDLINGEFDTLEIPFFKGQAILPSTLLESPKLTFIQELK